LDAEAGRRVMVMAPLERQRKGVHRDRLESLASQGFARIRIDGKVTPINEAFELLDKKKKHDLDLVIDRIVVDEAQRARLGDSVETALREGGGSVLFTGDDFERVFSERAACVKCGISFGELTPLSFSFNSPLGFCTECNGLGSRPEMDPDLLVPNPALSIRNGAVAPWAAAMSRGDGWINNEVTWIADTFGVDLDRPWEKLPKAQRDVVMYGSKRGRTSWEGLVNQLMRRLKATTSEDMKQYYLRYFSSKPCPACSGARLRPESRAVKIHGVSIDRVSAMRIEEALRWIDAMPLSRVEARIAEELRKEIRSRLGFLANVGLGYLSLDRGAASLSGGESQRIRLASQIGSELTGVIYVLDEPSIGLHQRDNRRLLETLKALRDLGNSVLVVEHDEETMLDADYIVDFGPGAGELGGEIVAQGTLEEVKASERSITGAFLSGRRRIELPAERRPGNGHFLEVRGARENNLANLDVRFPLGTLIAVTGVSGAGKSTLINGILRPALSRALHESRDAAGEYGALLGVEHVDKVIAIDQKPIGRTPRSNPATYTKVFDQIRDLYASLPEARAFGYDAGRFSFNVKGGRCEACSGDGVRCVEMHFLPDVYVTCEVCKGRRFNDATLRVRFKGLSIADTLDLSVRHALEVFSVHTGILRGLQTLDDVGLGYIKVGQPSPTLSGGEAQRIKLSRELSRVGTGRTVYVLDEPTTGLHFADVERLLHVLSRLVDAGNTLIVIEHNLDVIAHADWVIDLGPEGGSGGGRVVAEGTPERVAGVSESYTGRYLAELLRGRGRAISVAASAAPSTSSTTGPSSAVSSRRRGTFGDASSTLQPRTRTKRGNISAPVGQIADGNRRGRKASLKV
ncbi:MAG TPA: excinuclease ABC subunit UvrA, partial [Polyangiaceae bacterium]|nr:excinuclease ABC subunit UvrA [Polyangiaceae bacterium]